MGASGPARGLSTVLMALPSSSAQRALEALRSRLRELRDRAAVLDEVGLGALAPEAPIKSDHILTVR